MPQPALTARGVGMTAKGRALAASALFAAIAAWVDSNASTQSHPEDTAAAHSLSDEAGAARDASSASPLSGTSRNATSSSPAGTTGSTERASVRSPIVRPT